jgi:hypothetical protein
MLRDKLPTNQMPDRDAISIPENYEISHILAFIDHNIVYFFQNYSNEINETTHENRITDCLINHFQICIHTQSDGFLPYYFHKNPTQEGSDSETDIGVYPTEKKQKVAPIIEFEAKRLSETSNNKEYVAGKRGGIERFKRGYHARYASICGMFGYVQSRTTEYWAQKINTWIDELARYNNDTTIDWSGGNEKLTAVNPFSRGEKCMSNNKRKGLENILIWHYFLDLTSQEVP